MEILNIRESIKKLKESSYINIYEWEAALLIYEYLEDYYDKMTDEQIKSVYDMVHSKDDIFDECLKDEVQDLERELEEENNQQEQEHEEEIDK